MKKSKSKVFLMCGIPGSGKTTFIKTRLWNYKLCYISRDKIRFSLLKDNEDYFSREKQVYKEFIKEINNALARDEERIIVDATHLTVSSRNKILKQLKYIPAEINAVYVDCPLDVAIERNSHRTGRELVPTSAIENMYKSLQKPTIEEGFSSILAIDKDGRDRKVESKNDMVYF